MQIDLNQRKGYQSEVQAFGLNGRPQKKWLPNAAIDPTRGPLVAEEIIRVERTLSQAALKREGRSLLNARVTGLRWALNALLGGDGEDVPDAPVNAYMAAHTAAKNRAE